MSDMATMLDAQTGISLRTFTVDEYHRMAEAGLFDEAPMVELLDGLVVAMPPIGERHWVMHALIVEYLIQRLNERVLVVGQISVPLGDRDEPQPDIALVARSAITDLADRKRRVVPSEVLALIEIAETSLLKDLGFKRRLYSDWEIPTYLVVDLPAGRLRKFSRPVEGDYASEEILGRGDAFTLEAFPDVTLEVGRFLPPG
jgi:Uma2 family endonuclease